MQGGGEVQAGPSGTATPACVVRAGGRPLSPPFARSCAPHEKKTATLRVAPCMLRKSVQWTRDRACD
eukprot:434126-Prymnesium_polylepis.1